MQIQNPDLLALRQQCSPPRHPQLLNPCKGLVCELCVQVGQLLEKSFTGQSIITHSWSETGGSVS